MVSHGFGQIRLLLRGLSRITDDILIIRGDKVMVTWQWLSYSRYFREDEYAPLSMEPASYSDYSDSGMFS